MSDWEQRRQEWLAQGVLMGEDRAYNAVIGLILGTGPYQPWFSFHAAVLKIYSQSPGYLETMGRLLRIWGVASDQFEDSGYVSVRFPKGHLWAHVYVIIRAALALAQENP